MLDGLPPVTWPTMPGNESDGTGVSAWVNSAPFLTRRASADPGWCSTYHARSVWCSPPTEMSRTCLAGDSPALAGWAAKVSPAIRHGFQPSEIVVGS